MPTRLSEWVPKLIDRLNKAPELLDVASDLQDRGLQAFLHIDRDAASRLGISVSAIDDALYDAFGQRLISTIYTQANQYRVVLEAAPRYQIGPDSLGQIHVATGDGQQVPLANIARVEEQHTRLVINHAGQFPAVTLSFNIAPGRSLGEAVAAIETAQQEIGLPPSIQTRFQGAAEAFRNSLDSTLLLDSGARNRDLDESAKQRPQPANIIASGWHNRPISFLHLRSHAATTRSRPRYCECPGRPRARCRCSCR